MIGKYKKKIYSTFLLVFCILIIGFMGILFKLVLEKEVKEKETVIQQAIKTSFSNSQLKFAVINSALEMVTESKALSDWAESNNDKLFYFCTVQVQKEIIKAVSRVNNINFQIATTYLDDQSLVVTPISTQSKNLFFKENLKLNENQIANIYNHFSKKSDYMVFQIDRKLNKPEICYITKKNYSNRSLLCFTTISFQSFFDESKDYEWYISNKKGIFANDKKATIPKKELYEFYVNNNWIKQFQFKDKIVYTQTFANIDWSLLTTYKTTRFDKKVFVLYFLIPCIFCYYSAKKTLRKMKNSVE